VQTLHERRLRRRLAGRHVDRPWLDRPDLHVPWLQADCNLHCGLSAAAIAFSASAAPAAVRRHRHELHPEEVQELQSSKENEMQEDLRLVRPVAAAAAASIGAAARRCQLPRPR